MNLCSQEWSKTVSGNVLLKQGSPEGRGREHLLWLGTPKKLLQSCVHQKRTGVYSPAASVGTKQESMK